MALQYFALAASLVSGGMSYSAGKSARESAKLQAAREDKRSKAEAEMAKLQGQQQMTAIMQAYVETTASNIATVSALSGRDISDRSIQAALEREQLRVTDDLTRTALQADFGMQQTLAQGQMNVDRLKAQGRAAYKQGIAGAINSAIGGATSYKALS